MADLYYVEEGYWEVGYAVYIAEADLVAFNTAAISCLISVLYNSNADLTTTTSLSADVIRFRNVQSNLTSAFALTADVEIAAPGGVTKEFEAVIITSSSLSVSTSLTKLLASNLSAAFTQTATISHIEGADLQAFTENTLSATASVFRTTAASLSSESSISTSVSAFRTAAASLSSQTTFTSSVTKVIEASVDLRNYYDNDGYYLDDYYIVQGIKSTVSVNGGRSLGASCSLTVTFTATATISHIEGADLFAMTNASLAAQVSRIRDNNIAVSSVFSISTDASRTRNISSTDDAAFSINIINARTRATEAAFDAAFSLSATSGRIKSGSSSLNSNSDLTATISHIEGADLSAFTNATLSASVSKIVQGGSDLQNTFTSSITNSRTRDYSSSLTVSANLSATISHIEGADLQAFNTASLTVNNLRNRTHSSDQFADFTISLAALRVRFSQAALSATSSLTANVDLVPGGEVLEGAAALQSHFNTDIHATRKRNIIDCDVVVTATQTAVGRRLAGLESEPFEVSVFVSVPGPNRIRNANAALSTLVTQTSQLDGTLQAQASLTTTVNLSATISHIEGADLSAFTDSSLTAGANRLREVLAAITSAVTQTTTVSINKTAESSLSSTSSISVVGEVYRTTSVTLSTSSSIIADIVVTRNNNASLASANTLATTALRIKQLSADCGSLFTPNINCVITVNSFAVLESQATVTASVGRTRPFASTQASSFTSLVNAVKTTVTGSEISASGSLVVGVIEQQIAFAANLNSTSTLASSLTSIKRFTINQTSAFVPTVTCNATKNSFAVLNSQATVTANLVRTKRFISSIASSSTLTATIGKVLQFNIAVTSTSSVSATGIRAIRILGDSLVQGQIVAADNTIQQADIFPGYASLRLFSPIVIGEGGLELSDGKFNNGLKFNSRASGHGLSHGPVYGSAGYLALRLDANGFDTNVYLQSSTNGTDWVANSHNINLTSSQINGIAYVNNQYVVYGIQFNSPSTYLIRINTSTNGTTWTSYTSAAQDLRTIGAINYSNGLWQVYGTSGNVIVSYTSSNLSTWTQRINTIPNDGATYSWLSAAVTDVATDGTNTVVIGAFGSYRDADGGFAGNEAMYFQSTNATTFTSSSLVGGISGTNPDGWTPYGITYSGSYWIVVGSLGKIYTSTNRTTWTARTSGTTQNLYSIAYNDGKYVAYGDGVILTSPDTVTWTIITTPVLVSDDLLYRNNGAGVETKPIYQNSKWIVGDFTSTNAVTWTVLDYQLPNKQPFIKYNYSSDWDTWKTMDFHVYIPSAPYQFTEFGLASKRGATNSTAWTFYLESQANGGLSLRMAWTGSLRYAFSVTNSFNYANWNHIRIVSNGTTGAVYLNGTRLGTITVPATWSTGEDTLNIGSSSWVAESQYSRPVDYFLDEVMFTQEMLNDPSATTITVPISPYVNNEYTSILLHYDTSFEDDPSTPIRVGQISTNATFTQIVNTRVTKPVSAALTSNTAQTVQAITVKNATANLSSNFTLSTSALDLDLAVAALTVSSSLTASGGVIKNASSGLSSLAQLSSSANRIKQGAATLQVNAFQLLSTGRIQGFGAYLEASTAASIAPVKKVSANSTLTSSSTVIATVKNTSSATAALASASTLTVVVAKTVKFTSTESTTSTLTVTVRKIIQGNASLSTNSTLTLATQGIVRVNISLFGQASLACSVKITRGAFANITTASSLTANAGKRVVAAAALQVSAFELVIGNVINLAFTETWIIEAENRNFVIATENRLWTIPAEVRIYTVKPIELEPAVWVVPSEDRTYIIKG